MQQILLGAAALGLLWAAMTIGVYITYRILDIADLTVEGSITLGASVAASMIAVERMSPKDVRASAQSLLVFATYGVGMLCGHLLSGAVHGYFTLAHDAHAWEHIFMVPICITVPAAIAFGLLFDEKRFRQNNALRDAG